MSFCTTDDLTFFDEKLEVVSQSRHESRASESRAYVCSVPNGVSGSKVNPTTTTGDMFVMINKDSQYDYLIEAIHVSETYVTAATDVLTIVVGPATGTPSANNTALTPINKNLGSSVVPSGSSTFDKWDGVGNGITGMTISNVLKTFQIEGTGNETWRPNGLIVPSGSALVIAADMSANTGSLQLSIEFSEISR